MDEADNVISADMPTTPAGNDPSWTATVPIPPELIRRLEVLTDEIGTVNPDASILGPVALGVSEPH